MLKFTALLSIILLSFHANGQNVAERLGYPADTKLLIIHADDLGVAHAENAASIKAYEAGCVNSASIMVPCPWFPEIARYVRQNGGDFGLHLTLTSEWDYYKWGPVSSRSEVSSLVNEEGYFYSSVDSVAMFAKPAEVEIELRNQIEKAIRAGIDITHLDTHMGAVAATPEILAVYIKMGREFKLPVLLTQTIRQGNIPLNNNEVVLDQLYQATPVAFESGMNAYYTDVLNQLNPGLNCLLVHVAYQNDEMSAITVNHPAWGAAWRQADFDFMTSPLCQELLKQNNIQLVTWKEIRDKVIRAE